jgi:hypothetical protein
VDAVCMVMSNLYLAHAHFHSGTCVTCSQVDMGPNPLGTSLKRSQIHLPRSHNHLVPVGPTGRNFYWDQILQVPNYVSWVSTSAWTGTHRSQIHLGPAPTGTTGLKSGPTGPTGSKFTLDQLQQVSQVSNPLGTTWGTLGSEIYSGLDLTGPQIHLRPGP